MKMDSQELGQAIRAGFAAQEQARTATVEMPPILSEQAPAEPKAREKWESARDAAEADYCGRLLAKATLTANEQTWLSREITKAVRNVT
jgi:hypothetical protein